MKNFGKDINEHIEEQEDMRLRGGRLSKIKKDLADRDMDPKAKSVIYSEHLAWFLKTVERIYTMSNAAGQPGVYDKDPMSLGIANGLIAAMAIIVEEQSRVPYLKIPKKYRNGQEVFDERVEEYIARLESLIGAMIVADQNGPKGFSDSDNPMLSWVDKSVETISAAPISTDKLVGVRQQIRGFMKKIESQIYNINKDSNGNGQ